MLCRSLSLRTCRRGSNKPENLSRKLSKSRFPHLLLQRCCHPKWVQGNPPKLSQHFSPTGTWNSVAIAPARMSERSSRLLRKAKLLDWNLRYFGGFGSVIQMDVIDSEIHVLNPSTLQELDEAKRALEEEAAAATKVPSKHMLSMIFYSHVAIPYRTLSTDWRRKLCCSQLLSLHLKWHALHSKQRTGSQTLCASSCESMRELLFVVRERDDIVTSCVVLRFEMQWKSSKNAQGYGGFDWKVRENIAFSTVAVGQELAAALEKAWFTKKS